MTQISRRHAIATGLAGLTLPSASFASSPRQITWDDLIPPGVPYGQIIGLGEMDEINDTWNPVYDDNAVKLNDTLNGALVRLPGYIIPLNFSGDGVTEFVLVPYVGACIHVPPPPPNQLVFVQTESPWPSSELWDAIWVTGTMRTQLQSTQVAETGYALSAERMEPFEW